MKRIRTALVALLIAFAIAFSSGPLDGFFGGFAVDTAAVARMINDATGLT